MYANRWRVAKAARQWRPKVVVVRIRAISAVKSEPEVIAPNGAVNRPLAKQAWMPSGESKRNPAPSVSNRDREEPGRGSQRGKHRLRVRRVRRSGHSFEQRQLPQPLSVLFVVRARRRRTRRPRERVPRRDGCGRHGCIEQGVAARPSMPCMRHGEAKQDGSGRRRRPYCGL
jgi:hypothetical protein